jgi:outer membrane protein OmpA-like peptidoglycan-associated protein/tetratricopeptide (TPR) repeat protein
MIGYSSAKTINKMATNQTEMLQTIEDTAPTHSYNPIQLLIWVSKRITPKTQLLLNLSLIICILLSSLSLQAQKDDDDEPQNGCVTIKQISKGARKDFEKGLEAYQVKKYAESITFFTDVSEQEPTFADPFYLMGMITVKQIEKYSGEAGKGKGLSDEQINQMVKKAGNYFSQAIAACKEVNPYCYFYLGKMLYSQNRFKEAVAPFDYFLKNFDRSKNENDFLDAQNYYNYCIFLDQVLNKPVPFNLKKVEGISSPSDEYLFCISPDDEICFYTRVLQPRAQRGAINSKGELKEYFYISVRDSNLRFDNGNPMPEPFNKGENEGSPTITVDNKYMVFAKCNIEQNGYKNADLYFSEFKKDEWTPITNLGPNINTPNTWESQPSISPDGKTLYFITDRNTETSGYDIWVAHRDETGKWEKAQSIGNVINSKQNEKTPFIHSDSQTLYFSSDGHTSVGGMDIFYSKMNENGQWEKPKNIGVPINTELDDVGFFVSTDGSKGYYSSNSSGNFDLYEFELYTEARPQRVALIKGEVRSEDGSPIEANVELKNTETKKVIQIPIDQTTGKYAMVALLKNDYVLTVKKEGYAYETKYINSKDTLAPTTHKVDFQISPIEEGKSYKLNDIYFATNSFDLKRESKLVIDAFIEFLNENPTVNIEIQGHTDNVGNDNSNMVLSENRAKSVYDYIISTGVSTDRLSFKGYGETKPIATNDTEDGRAKNRRTVFVVLKK